MSFVCMYDLEVQPHICSNLYVNSNTHTHKYTYPGNVLVMSQNVIFNIMN